MRPGSSWTEVSSPGLMTSNIGVSGRGVPGQPGTILPQGEFLVADARMLVRPGRHLRVDVIPLFAVNRNEAHAVAGAEQRKVVAERRQALFTIPDRHRRTREDLIAAR